MIDPLSVFKMPPRGKITGRSSSITNSFVSSILPIKAPSSNEVSEALAVLGMTARTIACAYCGDRVTEWDHLRPLVFEKRPTGYISEIANLVPSCGKCNQSKGNRPWRSWITSDANLSPSTRQVSDLDDRVRRLDAYERWRIPTQIVFDEVVDDDLWITHWASCVQLHDLMRDAQTTADRIRSQVASVTQTDPEG